MTSPEAISNPGLIFTSRNGKVMNAAIFKGVAIQRTNTRNTFLSY